jgi:hypothetical protein
MNGPISRDERERGVDGAADRWAYLVLSYGLLAIVAYRSFVDRESSWDLLGLVILGGIVGAAYRIRERVASRSWLVPVGLAVVLATVIGVALAVTGAR